MSDNSRIDKKEQITGRLAALITELTSENEKPDLFGVPSKAIGKDGQLNWEHLDTGVEYGGSKITLPDTPARMSLREAMKALKRKEIDEGTEVDVHEVIDAFPTDGAVAFVKALRRTYGWANSVPTPSFFGPKPPQFITVATGPEPEDKIQVPWGGFEIPGIKNPIHTAASGSDDGAKFIIYGSVRKKEVSILKDLADLTREIVKEGSIYRGKALQIKQSGAELDLDNPPRFMSLKHVSESELVLSRDVEALVRTNIWNLIEHTERAKAQGIPLKRGVLLEGVYGTGKSFAALVTAKKAVENDWTYISIDRSANLQSALRFARRYEPCVIFCEDIDRATSERNEPTNDILNTLDGILSKDSQIMVVMTTNHVERIDRSMLRPGRLDAVISISPPDAEAVQRLLQIYGRDLIRDGEKLKAISKSLAGQVPATIREVIERAKLGLVGSDHEGITEAHLLTAHKGMEHHLNLLNRPRGRQLSVEERAGVALSNLIAERVADATHRATVVGLMGSEALVRGHEAESRLKENATAADVDRYMRSISTLFKTGTPRDDKEDSEPLADAAE